jgi:hypothetical protein
MVNDPRFCERHAPARQRHKSLATWENALPLLPGGQVAQEAAALISDPLSIRRIRGATLAADILARHRWPANASNVAHRIRTMASG